MKLVSRFLATTLLLATALFATTAQAVGFDAFDRMNVWAQSEFVAVMLDTTEKALKDDGRADYAAQMDHLFTTIEPGDSMSIGLVEYVRNEALARVADSERANKNPNARRLDVEDALFVTLKKNGIVMSDKAMNTVDASLANFHAETYAEFEAKSPAEQRRYIALLFKFALPDYVFRDNVHSQIESHKDGMFSDPDTKRGMLAFVNTQFPNQSTDQPGFADLAKAIKAEYTKSPDKAGPFFEITIYVLEQLDAQLVKTIDAMDAHTLLLPGGRHIYKDKNGDLWAVKKGSPDTKLDAQDTELANRISDCMTRRGISNGPEGLAACRDEVGIPRDDSTDSAPPAEAAAVPPPPAAEPPSPPASTPDDDPMGAGGFITPPDQGYVVLCVQSGLIQLYPDSWNTPDIGGKMVTFQNFISPYILSVAKPSWLYGIGDQAYARFNPAATRDPASFVFPIPPGQQTTPGSCPADYSPFWLWRKPLRITIPQ